MVEPCVLAFTEERTARARIDLTTLGSAGPSLSLDELPNTFTDFVVDFSRLFDRLSLWIFEPPVVAFHSRNIGTSPPHPMVTNTCASSARSGVSFVVEALVRSDFAHCGDHFGMHMRTRIRARGHRSRLRWIRKFVKQSRRHVRPSCIVNTGTKDGDHFAVAKC